MKPLVNAETIADLRDRGFKATPEETQLLCEEVTRLRDALDLVHANEGRSVLRVEVNAGLLVKQGLEGWNDGGLGIVTMTSPTPIESDPDLAKMLESSIAAGFALFFRLFSDEQAKEFGIIDEVEE